MSIKYFIVSLFLIFPSVAIPVRADTLNYSFIPLSTTGSDKTSSGIRCLERTFSGKNNWNRISNQVEGEPFFSKPLPLLYEMVKRQRSQDVEGVAKLYPPSLRPYVLNWFGDGKPSFRGVDISLKYEVGSASVRGIKFVTSWKSRSTGRIVHIGYARAFQRYGEQWKVISLDPRKTNPIRDLIHHFDDLKMVKRIDQVPKDLELIAGTGERKTAFQIWAVFREINPEEKSFYQSILSSVHNGDAVSFVDMFDRPHAIRKSDGILAQNQLLKPVLNGLRKTLPPLDKAEFHVLETNDFDYLFVCWPKTAKNDKSTSHVFRIIGTEGKLALVDPGTQDGLLDEFVEGEVDENFKAGDVFSKYFQTNRPVELMPKHLDLSILKPPKN